MARSALNKDVPPIMASMRFRSSLPRFSLALVLLAPGMCVAGELQPEQRAYYMGRLGLGATTTPTPAPPNAAAEAVIEWQALVRNQRTAGFDRIAAFLIANPGWPQEADLRRAAEASLDSSGYIPASAIRYFQMFAPQTASSHLRYAQALLAGGQRDQAAAEARLAWIGGALSADEETRVMTLFPGAIAPADQDLRMEQLLWSNSTTSAARQLTRVTPARSAEFTARLAMRTRATGAALRAAEAEGADPSLVRRNAGYIADKARWLSATGQQLAARALMASPRQLAAPPLDADAWLGIIVSTARNAAGDGDWQRAYDIARQVDDALPVGTLVAEQPLGVRDDYTNAVWLAAETARKQLGRPREAIGLYALYSGGSRSPQVRARGLYWAGRAALAAGDNALATSYFERASAFYDQFHGQLALERLGRAQPAPANPQLSFSAAQRDAFNNNSLVRAARVLGELGAYRDQTQFLRAIAMNAKSDADHYFAAQLASDINRPDLGVMIGRSARLNGLDDYVPVAFPTLPVPTGLEPNWTLIHAISRQESQFDRAAMSRVGARGLMQLMPATAREQAGHLGLGYDLSQLTDDPSYNIMLGSAYFDRMLRYYGGSYPLAIASYNAGPGNVNRWLAANGDPRTGTVAWLDWIEQIPISETRNYVQRVLENAVVYDTLNPNRRGAEVRNALSRYIGKDQPG